MREHRLLCTTSFADGCFPEPTLAAAKPRSAPSADGPSGPEGPSSVKASGTSLGGSRKEPKVEEGYAEDGSVSKQEFSADSKRFVLQDTLDYSQFYPTALPLQVGTTLPLDV